MSDFSALGHHGTIGDSDGTVITFEGRTKTTGFAGPVNVAGPVSSTSVNSSGPVTVGASAPSAACSSGANVGALRYNPTTRSMELCNGTAWGSLSPTYTKALSLSGAQNINALIADGVFWGNQSVATYCKNTSGQTMQVASEADSSGLVAIELSPICLEALCMIEWPNDGHPISNFLDGSCNTTNGCKYAYMHVECTYMTPGYQEQTAYYPANNTALPFVGD